MEINRKTDFLYLQFSLPIMLMIIFLQERMPRQNFLGAKKTA